MQITLEKIVAYLKKVEDKKPLIHAITNEITVNDVANSILAIGASPTMAHHIEEVVEFSRRADCLLINLGATEYLDQIYEASKVEWVKKIFDPVGVAASSFRRKHALEIIEQFRPQVIRGNASEIISLSLNTSTARGVDEELRTGIGLEELEVLIKDFANKSKAIVVCSGKTDLISDGKEVYRVDNGSAMMKSITGSGCMSSGVIATFFSVNPSLEAVISACVFMALCGELAEKLTLDQGAGSGSFKINLMDSLSRFKDWCLGLKIKMKNTTKR